MSAPATGIGDILLRTSYCFLSMPGGGLAVAVDGRIPSGNTDDLLGAGGQVKVFLSRRAAPGACRRT